MGVRYADAAPVLLEQGWGTPVPSDPESKRPLLPNWSFYNHHRATEQQVELWCSRWPDANTAIAPNRADGVLFADIDFDEPGLALVARSAANEHLGISPFIRVGRDPRQVRLYRLAEPIDDVDRPGLELTTGAGLITLYGVHAGTGLPYYWPDSHPMEAEPSDLPIASPATVQAFLDAMGPFIKSRVRVDGVSPFDRRPAAPLLSAIADNPEIPILELLASVMAGAVEGCRRSSMFGCVVAAVMRGCSDAEVTDALLPVYQALHHGQEHRGCSRAFRDALAWIRERHGPDRYEALEIRAALPWARRF